MESPPSTPGGETRAAILKPFEIFLLRCSKKNKISLENCMKWEWHGGHGAHGTQQKKMHNHGSRGGKQHFSGRNNCNSGAGCGSEKSSAMVIQCGAMRWGKGVGLPCPWAGTGSGVSGRLTRREGGDGRRRGPAGRGGRWGTPWVRRMERAARTAELPVSRNCRLGAARRGRGGGSGQPKCRSTQTTAHLNPPIEAECAYSGLPPPAEGVVCFYLGPVWRF